MKQRRDTHGVLKVILDLFSQFAAFDSKMQISTALTLLYVALLEGRQGGVTTREIEKRIGMPSGTGSRNVMYWGEGYKEMPHSGYRMVEARPDPADKRQKILSLTEEGRAFVATLLAIQGDEGARRHYEFSHQRRRKLNLHAGNGSLASYAPDVTAKKAVRRFALGPHAALLLRNPPSLTAREGQQSPVRYLWALAILDADEFPDLFASLSPLYVVTLERGPGELPMLHGFDRSGQHVRFGAAPELRDEDKFVERASQLMRGILGIEERNERR